MQNFVICDAMCSLDDRFGMRRHLSRTTYGNIVARAECDVRACPAQIEIGLAFVALRHRGRASVAKGFVEVL